MSTISILKWHKILENFTNYPRTLIIHFIVAGTRKQYENDNDSSLIENVLESMRNLLGVMLNSLLNTYCFLTEFFNI